MLMSVKKELKGRKRKNNMREERGIERRRVKWREDVRV